MCHLASGQEEAAGMGLQGTTKTDSMAESFASKFGLLAHILKVSGDTGVHVAVDVSLANRALRRDLKAVRLKEASFSGTLAEPGQLGKKPGVVNDQIIFEVTAVVIAAEPA